MSYLTIKNQYLTLAGQELAYREVGKGKSDLPLVMLTHLAATMDNWDPKLLDLLAVEQHLIVMDLPGVGSSQGQVAGTIAGMAQQAIKIIKALGYERINLLGLSMGGMIAQEIVRAQPDLVNRLILAGTGPRGGKEIDKVTGKTFKFMLRASLTGVDPKRYIFYPHDEAGGQVAEEVLGRMAERQAEFRGKEMKISSFLTQLKAIKRWGKEAEDDLSFIKQETLIVNGDNDQQVPTENSYIMNKKITTSRLMIYSQAGHGSIFQYADQFAQDLLAFLG